MSDDYYERDAAYYAYMESASLAYADAPSVSTDSDPDSALLDTDVVLPAPWTSPDACDVGGGSGAASYAAYQHVASREDARELASLLAEEENDEENAESGGANKAGRRPKQSVLQRRRRNRESMRRSRMKEKVVAGWSQVW